MRHAWLPGVFAAFPSCVAVAFPPTALQDPAQVYLLHQGAHTGVILPTEEEGEACWVEYAFGNWEWYGEQRGGTLDALYALAVPNEAALGRRYSDAPPTEDALLVARGATVQGFQAERVRVRNLRRALDEEFEASSVPPRLLERNGLWIAKARRGYSMDSNCSDATLDWMCALGCEVIAPVITRSIELRGPRE
jgi:hypothetical protein